ncbi:MAG: hypothetical protein LBR39_08675 [Coriobacteriales bacterium]|nr:hypothetical protein [Coriobacteriales bacterium]
MTKNKVIGIALWTLFGLIIAWVVVANIVHYHSVEAYRQAQLEEMELFRADLYVAEIVSVRRGWTLNKTLSELTKTEVYALLVDSKSKLWTHHPSVIADMSDCDYTGEPIPPELYFV